MGFQKSCYYRRDCFLITGVVVHAVGRNARKGTQVAGIQPELQGERPGRQGFQTPCPGLSLAPMPLREGATNVCQG